MKKLLLVVVCGAVLTFGSEARAQMVYNFGGTYAAYALVLGFPVAGSLVSDIGILVSLGSDGTVSRGWSITGTVFGSLNTLIGMLWLLGATNYMSSLGASVLFAPGAYLVFGAGSLALSVFAMSRPPEPGEGEVSSLGPRRSGPRFSFMPFVVEPRAGAAPGLLLSGRF